MSEFSELPNNHPDRQALAKQLNYARSLDRERTYATDRGAVNYLQDFRGLGNFLDYVRNNASAKTMLDIGAGKTKAIFELGLTPMTKDLRLLATVLSYNPEIQDNLALFDPNAVKVTSGELLKGVTPNSIGGILACYSLTYSDYPEQVVNKVNEVLCAGGAIKMVCRGDLQPEKYNAKTVQAFLPYFQRLGYNVATYQSTTNDSGSLLVGIKPNEYSASNPNLASELLNKDKKEMSEQIRQTFEDIDKGILYASTS